MGQAKNRGTFEERQAEAVKKREAAMEKWKAERRKHWDSLSPQQKQAAVSLLGITAAAELATTLPTRKS